MEIKVKVDTIIRAIKTIKELPVQCDFDAADRWVGVVMVLENLLQTAEITETPKEGE